MSVSTPEAALPRVASDGLLIVSVLGEGGSSVVYRAWRVEAGEWCAVKLLKPGKSAKLRRRFLVEARMLCDLSHRNLVKGFEVHDDERPWFSMEIADGGSLKDWCTRHGAMHPRLAVDVAVQICKGVAIAHNAGYVHRDIKPHNVLVNRRGVCKLTDFGVARVGATARPDDEELDFSTASDALGTIGYMAPEQQADPTSVDARSDVYGIGATLLHLLTGAPPPGNLFMAAREYPELFEGIPDVLVPVLRKCTEYRRDDRYGNAGELARALHEIAEFLPPAPRGAPTLTTGIALEPMPPPGMVSRTPVSGPSMESAPPSSMPPSVPPQGTPSPVAFRRTVSPQPEPEPEPPQRTRWPLVFIGLFAQAFFLFSLDVAWVSNARHLAEAAEPAFVEAARRNAPILDEIGANGAERTTLEHALAATRGGSPMGRRAAARSWLEQLAASVAAHPPESRTAVVVEGRLHELTASLDTWSDALDEWERRASSTLGRVVSPIAGSPDKAAGGGR